MNSLTHLSTPRTFRRVSAEAIAHFAATDTQAARFASLAHHAASRAAAPARFWDSALIDRLSAPLSRVRE